MRSASSASAAVSWWLRWERSAKPKSSSARRVRLLMGRPSMLWVPAPTKRTASVRARPMTVAITERAALPVHNITTTGRVSGSAMGSGPTPTKQTQEPSSAQRIRLAHTDWARLIQPPYSYRGSTHTAALLIQGLDPYSRLAHTDWARPWASVAIPAAIFSTAEAMTLPMMPPVNGMTGSNQESQCRVQLPACSPSHQQHLGAAVAHRQRDAQYPVGHAMGRIEGGDLLTGAHRAGAEHPDCTNPVAVGRTLGLQLHPAPGNPPGVQLMVGHHLPGHCLGGRNRCRRGEGPHDSAQPR